jgi:hypothetical protein
MSIPEMDRWSSTAELYLASYWKSIHIRLLIEFDYACARLGIPEKYRSQESNLNSRDYRLLVHTR